ncbi:hypothetical protein HF086_001531 [Spodoptera exigua]|uniref:Medium-chain acyl-CoA ligase ACSF2, mitochondrial n=1 Tax=Spodoptera exigua TaxID=7107 RepID=A0A922SAB3_SPOEX|nr:hypothetical protein HF086_001531 [Spodoptera exigua]
MRTQNALSRSQESAEAHEMRLSIDRERHAKSRASETFTQRETRLSSQRNRTDVARSCESVEGRQARLESDRERHAESRASVTYTQREARSCLQRSRASFSRSIEDVEERETRLRRDRSQHALSRSLETDEQREERRVSCSAAVPRTAWRCVYSSITRTGQSPRDSGNLVGRTACGTSDPKAALDSHMGVVNNTYFVGKRNTLDEAHHTICVQVPLFHALGSIVTILGGLRHGSSLVLAGPIYNVDDNINALFAEKCSVIFGTPTMFVDMLAKIRTMGDVPSKLRLALAAGAPCSPQLIRDMQKYLKTETVKGLYGMTETTACVFQSVPGDSIDVVAETVGYIQDHVEVKVVDEKGDMVPFGSPGELVVRGYNIMIGYWDDPVKTRQALSEDGWLKTGDKFTISEDGYGRIVGRLKDIIVRGGENIAPKEIEDLLITHPDIEDCQRLGEELCAVLRVKEGASVTMDEVRRHCDGRLARFKIPRVLKTIEEFPKTASGKIQKYRLKEMIESGKL